MLLDDELLTVHDIADVLKVNQQTVRNWIDADELAAIRVGKRRVRVRRRDLEKFLARSNRSETGEVAPAPAFSEAEAEAWEVFGRAMARTTQRLKRKRSQEGLVETLRELAIATHDLSQILQEGLAQNKE